MWLEATCVGSEAQRFALEAAPYGAGWAEVAYDADVIFVYEKEPFESGPHFHALLGYGAEGNEEGGSGPRGGPELSTSIRGLR